MKQEIPFKGQYWWSDSDDVITKLRELLKQITSETQVHSITISGTDFQDGRQTRKIDIKVDIFSQKILIEKNY